MKKTTVRRGHTYPVDSLGTFSILFGVACVGFIIYNVFNVIFS